MVYQNPEIIELCNELEELGGGIRTRIESIKCETLNFKELSIERDLSKLDIGGEPELLPIDFVSKSTRPGFDSSFIVFNENATDASILTI